MCCLSFLLLLNLALTIFISKEICEIGHLFWKHDTILMPGGESTFCNDFCADFCVNNQGFECDIASCLTGCTAHFDDIKPDWSM